MSSKLSPVPLQSPMVDQNGAFAPIWKDWFLGALKRLGGNVASTNTELDAAITALKNNFVPAGSLLAFAGTTAPASYLICDGSAVSRAAYPALFTAIGTSHGSGDGTTTFNVPDLRGRFIRGVDGSASRDPNSSNRTAMASGGNAGNNVGSVQGYATSLPITSFTTDSQGSHSSHWTGVIAAVQSGAGINALTAPTGPTTLGAHTHTVTTGGDLETRPINANENYIIKT